MSILLQSRLSLISVPAAMRQFMTLNSGAAHLMTRMWLILLRLLLDCKKFETEVSVFRSLYSCGVFPWIHVTSFMVSRIMVCSRILGGLGSCLFLSTLLKIVIHHYLGTGIYTSALGEAWQNPTDRLTAFEKYFSVAN